MCVKRQSGKRKNVIWLINLIIVIKDETATKPDDWDESAPKEIVDEAAEKPADWLEEEVR